MADNKILAWDSLKENRDFEEVSGGEYRTNCMFCEDTKRHLYVNYTKGVYHCFRCGAKGKLLRRSADKFAYLDNLEKKIEKGRYPHVDNPAKKNETGGHTVKTLPRNFTLSTMQFHETPAIDYLLGRGLTLQEIKDNDLRLSIDKRGVYQDTIIFPVGNEGYDYFVCRRFTELKPKYVNAPWPKFDTIYTPHRYCKNTGYRVVCEGVFDAIRIARVAPVGALLGKEATPEQLERLAKRDLPVAIMLDRDAAVNALRLKLEIITKGGKAFIVQLKSKDPGESTAEEIKEALDNAYLYFNGRSR